MGKDAERQERRKQQREFKVGREGELDWGMAKEGHVELEIV